MAGISRYPKCIVPKSKCVCVFSANATQRLLSAGIRQPTRRLCTRIGCWSRAPVGSSQPQAMKDCALTADQRARAWFEWLGSEKEHQRTSYFVLSCPYQPSLLFCLRYVILIFLCIRYRVSCAEHQQISATEIECKLPPTPLSRPPEKIPRWQKNNHAPTKAKLSPAPTRQHPAV